jgi:hypothetical protein
LRGVVAVEGGGNGENLMQRECRIILLILDDVLVDLAGIVCKI